MKCLHRHPRGWPVPMRSLRHWRRLGAMAALSGNGWLKTVVAVFILLWIAAAILVARLHRRRGGVWLTGLILGLILGPLEYKRMNFASLARFVGPKRRRGGGDLTKRATSHSPSSSRREFSGHCGQCLLRRARPLLAPRERSDVDGRPGGRWMRRERACSWLPGSIPVPTQADGGQRRLTRIMAVASDSRELRRVACCRRVPWVAYESVALPLSYPGL